MKMNTSTIFNLKIFFSIFFLSLLFNPLLTNGEGTEEIKLNESDPGTLIQIWDQNDNNRRFATYNSEDDYKLNIRVCDTSERIHFGITPKDLSKDVYYRLKDPAGNIVKGPQKIPTAGAGHIDNYDDAVAGPLPITGGPDGYQPITINPDTVGNYYIELNPYDPNTVNVSKTLFSLFDITVESGVKDSTAIDGRVWSKNWDFNTTGGNNKFKAKMYIFAEDSVVTSVDFNGIQPWGFAISANSTGLTNTGDPIFDRQSKYGKQNYPQYKIFLNKPDTSCFPPTDKLGKVKGKPKVKGCQRNNICIEFVTNKGGQVQIVLDLNGKKGYQPNTEDRKISKKISKDTNCIKWDTKNGKGEYVKPGKKFNLQVNYFNGLTHLPLYDVEHHRNGYTVELVNPKSGSKPELYWNDSLIQGTGTNLDGLSNLTGCTDPTGCHEWEDRGDNSNPETVNTWWFADSSSKKLSMELPIIEADAETRIPDSLAQDTTVCSNNNPYKLSGEISGKAKGGRWTALTGDNANFSHRDSLNATYTFTASEISNGKSKIELKSTGNGACTVAKDTLVINIDPSPNANAGPDRKVCYNSPTASLDGSFSNANGVFWHNGKGVFSPDSTDPKASYTPSNNEINNKDTIKLYLTTNSKDCFIPVTDSMNITFKDAPVPNAGKDTFTCKKDPEITLNGNISNSGSGHWKGNGTFSPDSTDLNATYQPTSDELDQGYAQLVLVTDTAKNCLPLKDTLNISYVRPYIIDAGTPQNICQSTDSVTLSGSFNMPPLKGIEMDTEDKSNVTVNGNWKKSTWVSGYKENNYIHDKNSGKGSKSVVFTPDIPKKDKYKVFINYTSDNNRATNVPVDITHANGKDTVIVNQEKGGGTYQSLGTFNFEKGKSGSVTIRTDGTNGAVIADAIKFVKVTPPEITWTKVSGSLNGTFKPSADSFQTDYFPTAAEKGSGAIKFLLKEDIGGSCSAENDTVEVTFEDSVQVDPGSDKFICVYTKNPSANLNGTLSNVKDFTWKGNGGTFSPNNKTEDPEYYLSDSEISTLKSGGVTKVTLEAEGNGPCKVKSKNVAIFPQKQPTVDAGNDTNICTSASKILLEGKVTDATSINWDGGDGSFDDPGSDTTFYNPTNIDRKKDTLSLILSAQRGTCNPVKDTMQVIFKPDPSANAGNDISVCSNNPQVSLNGSVNLAKGGRWSGGNGTFNPSPDSLNTQYNPANGEISDDSLILTLKTTGTGYCKNDSDAVKIYFTDPPTVDAGPDMDICENNPDVKLNGSVTVAGGGEWSGGSGNFISDKQDLNATYEPTDVEINSDSLYLTLTSINNGNCKAVEDSMKINFTPAPNVNAGPDDTVCADDPRVNLNGSVTTPANGGLWTNYDGFFTPDDESLNTTYHPSSDEISSGNVKLNLISQKDGNCNHVRDSINIRITPKPSVDAGGDRTVCGDADKIKLNGNVNNAGGGVWSTSGTGSFSPDKNNLNADYVFSNNDKKQDSIILTLTSTKNGECKTYKDSIEVEFSPVPTVNAGADQKVCPNDFPVQLNASGNDASWVNGNGSFSPSRNVHNPEYTPSSGEVSSGSVSLIIRTNPGSVCDQVEDTVNITIPDAPVVDAGSDQTVCTTSDAVSLNGSVTNAPGGVWSTSGSGIFQPSATQLNANYEPTSSDKLNSSVKLYLKSSGNKFCSNVKDSMKINFQQAVKADAGPDETYCASKNVIKLKGDVQNTSGGQWSIINGNGSVSDIDDLKASYSVSSNDTANGFVSLELTADPNSPCNNDKDTVKFTFQPLPNPDAGSDFSVCSDTNQIKLNGNVNNAGGGEWSSSGTGTFSPNEFDLKPFYNLSAGDHSQSSLDFVLTTTSNKLCDPVKDTVNVNLTPGPEINPGSNSSVCAADSVINLNGNASNVSSVTWNTFGTGNFDDNTNLSTKYNMSADDINNGSVTLSLTGEGMGLCNSTSKNIQFDIKATPIVDAGLNRNICASNSSLKLNGDIKNASGGEWKTLGKGSFSPDKNTLNATYTANIPANKSRKDTLVLTSTGNGVCDPVRDTMVVNIQSIPVVDAGNDQTVCADTAKILLNGSVSKAKGGEWSSQGNGLFSPSAQNLDAEYRPSDKDTARDQLKLYLTSTGNGVCSAETDSMIISFNPAPVVDAGADKTICADQDSIDLDGSVANADGEWNVTGNGTFNKDKNDLDGTYSISEDDSASGSLTFTLTSINNGMCKTYSDKMIIDLQEVPHADAGLDKSICRTQTKVSLNGKISNAGGGKWNSNGKGVFTPNKETINATYNVSSKDKNVNLTLTTTGNGVCSPDTDDVNINIKELPEADAGPDETVCEDTSGIDLNGTVKYAGGGKWQTTGKGSFFPNANTTNPTYKPGLSDTTITLSLITTGNNGCKADTSTKKLKINPAPVVDAGPDKNVCSDFEQIPLNDANIKNASGGIWSTNGSGVFADSSNINGFYSLDSNDIDNGQVRLTLTSTGNGLCKPVSSSIDIKIFKQPKVKTNPDQTVCEDIDSVQLNANIKNVASVKWNVQSSANGSFSPSNDSLSPYFIPTSTDLNKDSIVFWIDGFADSVCTFERDKFVLKFDDKVNIDAGPDTTQVCTNQFPIQLQGSGTSGKWTGGEGTYSPDSTSLNAEYTPSSNEINNGQFDLILKSTSKGGTCDQVKDTITYNIPAGPTVDIGNSDKTVCSSNPDVNINIKDTSNTNGVKWSSLGTGNFSPNNQTLNITYNSSKNDIKDSSVILSVETTGNKNGCPSASDKIRIYYKPAPVAKAGFDQKMCEDKDSVHLSGQVENISGGSWSSSGTGNFVPGNSDLNAVYVASDDDKKNTPVTLTLTTNSNAYCNAKTDQLEVDFTPGVTVNAGNYNSICEDADQVQLTGTYSVASGISWSSNGTGLFSPSNTNKDAVYALSSNDKKKDTVEFYIKTVGNGDCDLERDTAKLNIQKAPEVSAIPNDITVCENNKKVNLNADTSNTKNINWSSSGDGNFDNKGKIDPVYTPGSDDINNLSVKLKVTASGIGVCDQSNDFVNVNIKPKPVVTIANGKQTKICKDAGQISLKSNVKNAGGLKWSVPDGNGTFIPDKQSSEIKYQITKQDTTRDTLVFYVTSTKNAQCKKENDSVKLYYTPVPKVKASSKNKICSTQDTIHLDGEVKNAQGGKWITNGSGFFAPDKSVLDAKYVTDSLDKDKGEVKLTLLSTGNGTCNQYKDTTNIDISPAPIANAGNDKQICENRDSIFISGNIANASGGQWSSSGNGSFVNNTNLQTSYEISSKDKKSGSVIFNLKTTGNGVCNAAEDLMQVNFTPKPTVISGNDLTVCETENEIALDPSLKEANGGYWKSTGTGSFSPAPDNLNAKYNPSTKDINEGSVKLILESREDGDCFHEKDSFTVSFTPKPVISIAGNSICGDKEKAPLQSNIKNAPGGKWQSSGSGTFSPDPFVSGPDYYPSDNEIKNGTANLSLTTNNNNECSQVTENVKVFITPLPEKVASDPRTVCDGDPTQLSAIQFDNTSYKWYSNTGNFIGSGPNVKVTVKNDTNFVVEAIDSRGCSRKDTMFVKTIGPPNLNLTEEHCYSDTLVLDSRPKDVPKVDGIFEWYVDDVIQFGDNDTTFAVEEPGTHQVSYKYRQCRIFDTSEVHELPEITFDDKIVCIGAATTLKTKKLPKASYNWYDLSTNKKVGNKHEVKINNASEKSYRIQVFNKYNCESNDTGKVSTVEKPVLTLKDTSVCKKDTALIDGRPTNIRHEQETFTWKREEQILDVEDTLTHLPVYETDTGSYQYSLKYAIDECITKDTSLIKVNPLPVPDNKDEREFCKEQMESITLDAGPAHKYYWFSTGDSTRTLEIYESDTYNFKIFNQYNCSVKDSIYAKRICEPNVFVPNAFSPNSDGKDDHFEIFGNNFKNFEMKIYNRWGEVIYHSTNPEEKWDGYYRGEPMPQGVYPYVITYEGEFEKYKGPHQKQGKITIVR